MTRTIRTPSSASPEGLAYGVEDVGGTPTEVLYVSEGNDCNPCNVYVYRADATDAVDGTPPLPIRTFGIPLNEVRGLDVMPNGNLLVTSVVGGIGDRVVGSLIAGGIDINVNATFIGDPIGATQPESVILHSNGSIFLGEEENDFQGPAEIIELDLTGTVLSRFDVTLLDGPNPFSPSDPAFEDPSGMDFDPVTGILLIADDSSGGGWTNLYAVTPTGTKVGQVNLGHAYRNLRPLRRPELPASGKSRSGGRGVRRRRVPVHCFRERPAGDHVPDQRHPRAELARPAGARSHGARLRAPPAGAAAAPRTAQSLRNRA